MPPTTANRFLAKAFQSIVTVGGGEAPPPNLPVRVAAYSADRLPRCQLGGGEAPPPNLPVRVAAYSADRLPRCQLGGGEAPPPNLPVRVAAAPPEIYALPAAA